LCKSVIEGYVVGTIGKSIGYMNRDEIRNLVRESLVELIDNEAIVVTDATVAEDVDGWDSIVHIKLLFAIETALGIQFEVSEMAAPADVGELLDLIQSKL
jgi:acyl carrier protein